MLYPSCYVLVPQSEFSHHHAMAVQAGGYIPPPSMGLGHGKINGPATPGELPHLYSYLPHIDSFKQVVQNSSKGTCVQDNTLNPKTFVTRNLHKDF